MKMPALLVAAVALSACSTSAPVGQSAETPLNPYESLDVAKGPTAAERGIEPAKAITRNKNEQAAAVAEAPAKSNDATCNRGMFEEDRTFIICEDGALRKAGVVATLSAPHDPDLLIEDVAATYDVPSQIFSGIQSATYSTLINGNRNAPRKAGKHKAQTGLVQIEGKVYEVYQLSANGKTGTIFVEQSSN